MRVVPRLIAATMAAALGAAGILPAAAGGVEAPIRVPERLSETGLYYGAATGPIDAWNLPFQPQYPLWTDGATKSRWIRLPDGAAIDDRDVDAWVFPVGTKFWKEFAFGTKKVETRMIWRASATRWIFASYVWNDEQTEAFLAPEEGIPNHAPIAPGLSHSIPSVVDCTTCHGSGPTPILGFNALQLSDDRDPMAPHARPLAPGDVTLRTLDLYRLLSPRRRDLVEHPPRIHAPTPVERAALGYLAANCGHCHNSRGALAPLGMSLAHTMRPAAGGNEPAIPSTYDIPSGFLVPGVPEDASRRIAPGLPEASAIVFRMSSRQPSSQMPPLGTVLVDTEAVELLKRWIGEELK